MTDHIVSIFYTKERFFRTLNAESIMYNDTIHFMQNRSIRKGWAT